MVIHRQRQRGPLEGRIPRPHPDEPQRNAGLDRKPWQDTVRHLERELGHDGPNIVPVRRRRGLLGTRGTDVGACLEMTYARVCDRRTKIDGETPLHDGALCGPADRQVRVASSPSAFGVGVQRGAREREDPEDGEPT
jgi:hypothetical protein